MTSSVCRRKLGICLGLRLSQCIERKATIISNSLTSFISSMLSMSVIMGGIMEVEIRCRRGSGLPMVPELIEYVSSDSLPIGEDIAVLISDGTYSVASSAYNSGSVENFGVAIAMCDLLNT